MKLIYLKLLMISLILWSCSEKQEFTLSFASCNNQRLTNELWSPILSHNPDLFVWGGDIIYSDTYDMQVMKESYKKLKTDSAYLNFKSKVPVIGTWDDHDYGLNDGGRNYEKKDSVQMIFLDFFDVAPDDVRRRQKGVYHSMEYPVKGSLIKVIVLDTRYFRSDLTKDPTGKKRYIPDESPSCTMLGEAQWKWLEEELNESKAQFNVIVSSIQFLSCEHGFESWGNMPGEVNKMKKLIANSKARGVLFLSGDRHLAEVSRTEIEGLDYPLIDFTSSGMTHSYEAYSGEENTYRVSEVVHDKNFGILRFDFKNNSVTIEIRGEKNKLFQEFSQKY